MKDLRQLSEASRLCSNVDYRETMKAAAHACALAAFEFTRDITEENLTRLNGAWAHAARVYANRPPEWDPAPLSGYTEPARLAA